MSEKGKIVDELVCENCGSKNFIKGPRGGLAINVYCENCGKFYNICPLPNGKIWILHD